MHQAENASANEHESLKYQLLGPSLTKAGQDTVDQHKVSQIIYNASKGSKFFNNEEVRDRNLTQKIQQILARKRRLEKLELSHDIRRVDDHIAQLEASRDLTQVVVHIDCDAFYAAVEELDRPELKDVPFAVGKGVLTTCNYHARKFGCRSGMASFVATKLCPQLICLPLNFDKYTAKAQEVRAILADYDPRFESSSIDEAFLNLTEYCNDNSLDPDTAVSKLRAEVAEKTRITVSAGIGPNARIAKIASNKNKPNGQFRVSSERATVMEFMRDLPVRKVNGVGRVFERELDAVGIKTCGDIHAYRAYLAQLFGEKALYFLVNCFLGLGRTKIQLAEDYERKSVGTESTFHDLSGTVGLREKLRKTADELEKDLSRTEFKGRTLVLKVKLHTYEVLTRQVIPPKAVHRADDLYNYSLPMLTKLEKEIPGLKLRLLGLRVTNLVSTKKDGLDFFGIKNGAKRKHDLAEEGGSEWETWPEEGYSEGTQGEPVAVSEQLDVDEGKDTDDDDWLKVRHRRRKHGKQITPNMKQREPSKKPELWDCPICHRPQQANDKALNDHVDFCLSRQTIKEVVESSSTVTHLPSSTPTPALPPIKRNFFFERSGTSKTYLAEKSASLIAKAYKGDWSTASFE
ncbi:MAG: hypothetical protein M1826_001562 [Phylliscum demangeonii]|nr:MAG: hypothetical protein M1826_001562 [Phylliscum demangeonii]